MERNKKMLAIGMGILIVSATISNAHETYTGYSGAPGSEGACTPCHGTTGGQITATGFPSAYSPGAAYTIKIAHSSSGIIVNFNASCRVGASSQNAGTIAAGTNTAVYNVATYETNGVHFGTSMMDSGTFKSTAPPGTGAVKPVADITRAGESLNLPKCEDLCCNYRCFCNRASATPKAIPAHRSRAGTNVAKMPLRVLHFRTIRGPNSARRPGSGTR